MVVVVCNTMASDVKTVAAAEVSIRFYSAILPHFYSFIHSARRPDDNATLFRRRRRFSSLLLCCRAGRTRREQQRWWWSKRRIQENRWPRAHSTAQIASECLCVGATLCLCVCVENRRIYNCWRGKTNFKSITQLITTREFIVEPQRRRRPTTVIKPHRSKGRPGWDGMGLRWRWNGGVHTCAG